MKFPYRQGRARVPQVALRGGVVRPRPIISFQLSLPGGMGRFLDGQLDTGADDTILPATVAQLFGIDLTQAPAQDINLAGRGQPIRAHYSSIELRITDGIREAYEWTATVGFAPVALTHPLLGYAGFLEFFDAEFRGAAQEVILLANASFSGRHIVRTVP